MKYTKSMTLSVAKEELKAVSDRIKEIKRKNKFGSRKSNLNSLVLLFKKYHNGRFTMNKVRYIKGKKVFGDSQELLNLMLRDAWLKGYIVNAIHGNINSKTDEVKE